MDRDTARETVKGCLESYLQGKGINTRRPFNCLNPDHQDKHPSMSYDSKRQRCHCFSCGVSYDIFDLIGIDYGLTESKDIFEKAYSLYGLDVGEPIQKPAPQKTAPAPAPKKDDRDNYKEYYKRAKANISDPAAQEYLRKRGISTEVAEKHWIGYDPNYRTFEVDEAGNHNPCTWRVLIIPTGNGSYVARNIDKPKEPAKKNRYRNKGPSLLFNWKCLDLADKPVFVVEGELDALSIIEAGGRAVGLGSTSNCKKFLNKIEDDPPTQPIILALDADKEGQAAEERLAEGITALKLPFYRYNPYGMAKDANEALQADRDGFIAEIAKAEQAQQEELEKAAREATEAAKAEYMQTSAAAHIKDFVDRVKASIDTPVFSTGFSNLDSILDGGLYEGLYILGAISSLGKTTLALQISDQLAQQGQDVLIFSLEMSRYELMAKSISRITYLSDTHGFFAKTTRGITAGSRYKTYSREEIELINSAIHKYDSYAQHIFIHEGIGDIGVTQVREVVQQHISLTGNRPIVLIDYVQILAPYNPRSTDKQNTDKAVLELKRISRDFKIPVIGISSFNRDSYKTGGKSKGRVSMTDFKESGAVEYSADVLMGLEFTSAGSDEYNERAAKAADPRQIRLVILKNRNGKPWQTAQYEYYSLYNYFVEADEITDMEPEDIFKALRKI